MTNLGRPFTYGFFEKQKITPNGVSNVFTLNFKVAQSTSLLVVKNGLVLEGGQGGDYTVTGNNQGQIFFNVVPLVTDDIFIIFLGRELSVAKTVGLEPVYHTATGDGVTNTFTTPIGPILPEAIIVFVDKNFQRLNEDFTISGSDVIFSSAPANGVEIDFYIHGIERNDSVTFKGWTVDSTDSLIPNSPTQNLGSSTNPVNSLFVSQNAVIGGNLTVEGTTVSLDAENLLIEDNKITLNSNFTSGTPVLNIGVEGKRGDEPDTRIRWNEILNYWEAGIDGDVQRILREEDLSSVGIQSLNSLTDDNQSFQTGTSGTNFNINSSGSIHTFNIPDASETNRGLVTTSSQTFAGEKTFQNNTIFNGTITASSFSGSGNNITGVFRQSASAEINSLPTKVSPNNNDIILIEDSADSFNKKKILVSSISGVADLSTPLYIGDNGSSTSDALVTIWEKPTSTGQFNDSNSGVSIRHRLEDLPPSGDNKIFLVPYADNVLKIYNPDTDDYFVSSNPTPTNPPNYNFAIKLNDARIALLPSLGNVGYYDYNTDTITTSSVNLPQNWGAGRMVGNLLPNGNIIVFPYTGSTFSLTATIINPTTDTLVANITGMAAHVVCSVIMQNGNILMGHNSGPPFSSAYPRILNPNTQITVDAGLSTWNTNLSLVDVKMLGDGNIFCLCGGMGSNSHIDANLQIAIYNPNIDEFILFNNIPGPSVGNINQYKYARCVLLQDGQIFILPLQGNTAKIYDPISNTFFTSTATFPNYSTTFLQSGDPHRIYALQLDDGRIIFNGWHTNQNYFYDINTDTISTVSGGPFTPKAFSHFLPVDFNITTNFTEETRNGFVQNTVAVDDNLFANSQWVISSSNNTNARHFSIANIGGENQFSIRQQIGIVDANKLLENELVNITSSGNVGLGISNATEKLEVNGNIVANNFVGSGSQLTGINSVPVGSVLPFAGASAPSGYLLCNGQSITSAAYTNLFNVIGYTYGGSGPNFNVPDLRQRFPLGKSDSGTGSVLGSVGGQIDHTHTIPAHFHGMGSGADLNITSSGSHEHSINHGHTASSNTTGAHGHNTFRAGNATLADTALNTNNSLTAYASFGASNEFSYDMRGVFADADAGPTNIFGNHSHTITVNNHTGNSGPSSHTHISGSFSGRIGNVSSGNDGNASMNSGANNPPFISLNYIIKF